MSAIDLAILVAYVGAVLTIGFWVKRRASKGLESYFLGGRELPWWMIAMSGSSSYFDITGTMWIVSMFVAYGFNGFWIQWMWGFLIAAFYLAYMGKWIRRSGVMTGSEWMVYRFGTTRSGDMARLAYTTFAVLTLTTFIGYTAVGMGKFGGQFLPIKEWLPVLADWSPGNIDRLCAVLIIGVTGAYVVVGGFTGLTIVEFVQTIVLTTGAAMIAVLGFAAFDEQLVSGALAKLAEGTDRIVQVNPAQWYSLLPSWRIENQANEYALFGAVVITFLMKGLLLGLSGPEQLYDFQKFLATRNTREASLAGMLWGICHTVRFPMAMAITIMGLVAVAGSTEAGFDAEKVLPYVIAHKLPPVLKGIALAALISAFMATFGAMVNGSASYLIRDIYQRYLNPSASTRHYVRASYLASVLMILIGIAISFMSDSIGTMITWILGFLGSAVLIPNVLRWYWWRVTGYGFAAGMWTGMVLSLIQTAVDGPIARHMGWGQTVPVYYVIPVLALASAIACVAVTLLTRPPDMETLTNFYRTTQPAGCWGPVVEHIRQTDPGFRKEPFAPDVAALVVGLFWLGAMYVGPSYLVARQWLPAVICAVIVAIGSVVLARSWYRRLESSKSRPANCGAAL